MKPGLLASLLRDTSLIAQRAARLRELLPNTNISAMAAKLPEILLQVTGCCLSVCASSTPVGLIMHVPMHVPIQVAHNHSTLQKPVVSFAGQ